jgi:hypothetical protein
MIQPDLMKKTILLAVFLFINFQIAIGQTKYEVVRGIYLKANPDTYADDLMLIPAGKVVKKDLSSDYPFIRITYNGEIGYVSLNDLKVSKPEEKAQQEKTPDIDPVPTPAPIPPPKPETGPKPPQETEVVTIPWLEMLWPYLYLLLIIPILFFLVLTWILIRKKSNLKAAKQSIEKATADIKEARAIVEATKSKIYEVIDVFDNYSGLDSIITSVKASKVSADNSIRDIDKLALEINVTAKVIDAVTSTKEALEVRNSAEILKIKADTAIKVATDKKIAIGKEIDLCIGSLKNLTNSAANKAITDANLAKNIINNAKSDISTVNEIVDTGLTDSNKFVSNVSSALKSAKTKLERLKTNSDEIKLSAEKVQIKANNAISEANATSRGVASVRFAIDAKITAEKAIVSAAAALAEAKVIREKSENLRVEAEGIKIEVTNAIKEEIKTEEARKQAAIAKQNEGAKPIFINPIININENLNSDKYTILIDKLINKRKDWDKFRIVLDKWGITKLYHFTDAVNIPSIKKNGGIFSYEYCLENNIHIQRRGGNELSTMLDAEKNLQNYVRLSFVKEHPMLHVAKNDGRIVNPKIIEISLDIIYLNDNLFSNQNAAKKDVVADNTFEIFNSIKFNIFNKKYVELSSSEKSFYQAEVLVLKKVPLKYITNLNF